MKAILHANAVMQMVRDNVYGTFFNRNPSIIGSQECLYFYSYISPVDRDLYVQYYGNNSTPPILLNSNNQNEFYNPKPGSPYKQNDIQCISYSLGSVNESGENPDNLLSMQLRVDLNLAGEGHTASLNSTIDIATTGEDRLAGSKLESLSSSVNSDTYGFMNAVDFTNSHEIIKNIDTMNINLQNGNTLSVGTVGEIRGFGSVSIASDYIHNYVLSNPTHIDDVYNILTCDEFSHIESENEKREVDYELVNNSSQEEITYSSANLSNIGNYLQVNLADSDIPEIPKVLALYDNYPNPFNPQTQIEFVTRKKDNVKL